MKSNQDIRSAAAEKGIYLWEIAERLGTQDCNFSRKLRRELPQVEKDRIFKIIDEIKAERGA